MCFEVRQGDLLGRLGVVETKSGRFKTPALLPVVNPAIQLVSPRELKEIFGFEAIMTNAYILMKHYGQEASERGVHELLGFDGVVVTDSGAYQLLVYGRVDVSPDDVVAYQEALGSDIAVILDVPTGWTDAREKALKTVLETAERGRRLWEVKKRDDILWVGPIQGGRFPDLVARSAKLMSSMPFHIHALGSPTPVMEAYRFDVLVDMVMAAKLNIPPDRPLHLFGAGHPMTFALAVALGCDMFDSAAYALFARDGRYMMEHGTARVEELSYLPCDCPICSRREPSDFLEAPKPERERLLAMHNLYVCAREIRAIRQAIAEGRLWELLIRRAHAHPSMLKAVKAMTKYADVLEERSPARGRKGIFIFSSLDLARPELVRYKRRLMERFSPGRPGLLVLLPPPPSRPLSRSPEHEALFKALYKALGLEETASIQVCMYMAPFGPVPLELDQVHPLSQHETAGPDEEMISYSAEVVASFVISKGLKPVLLVSDASPLAKAVEASLRRAGVEFEVLVEREPWTREALLRLAREIASILGRRTRGYVSPSF